MPIDATQPYDDQNIFARILRGEIPNKTVYEDEWALAFHDINPQAPTHVQLIPKKEIPRLVDGQPEDAEAVRVRLMAAGRLNGSTSEPVGKPPRNGTDDGPTLYRIARP